VLVPRLILPLSFVVLVDEGVKSVQNRAVAHSILTIAYHLISRQEPYKDLGADYFDKQRPESVKKRAY